jgi:quercetin dioxygenase-like cupin family protein
MTIRPALSLAVLPIALLAAGSTHVFSQKAEPPPADTGKHILVTPTEITWTDAPPVLPAGAKMAVIEGNPTEPGLFTMRVKFPSGYRIQPHWHPADEHVTVLSGNFRMGLGEKFDEKALHDLPAGGFAVMAKGTRHFAQTKGATIIQVHAMGPWGLHYVNPADDPRQAQARAKK